MLLLRVILSVLALILIGIPSYSQDIKLLDPLKEESPSDSSKTPALSTLIGQAIVIDTTTQIGDSIFTIHMDGNGLHGKISELDAADLLDLNEEAANPDYQVSIYPNPSNGTYIVRSDQIIDHLKIYDMLGNLVQQDEISANFLLIEGNHLLHGTYIIHLSIAGEDWRRKIVVN